MDTLKTIGKVLTGEEKRDAIHIAVMPACAAMRLLVGESVFLDEAGAMPCAPSSPKKIGVVDPFLQERAIEVGQWFWLFLRPGTVESIRHDWTHPIIDAIKPVAVEKTSKQEAEDWLESFANKWDFNYNNMISEAQTEGGYAIAYGTDLHGSGELDDGDEAKFWSCMEIITGKQFDSEHREGFGWSCSC